MPAEVTRILEAMLSIGLSHKNSAWSLTHSASGSAFAFGPKLILYIKASTEPRPSYSNQQIKMPPINKVSSSLLDRKHN